MSAETLRRAAALMRERARAASPSPWEPYPDERGISDVASRSPERAYAMLNDGTLGAVASLAYDDDAAYIASWHPTVALAVANWLDNAADRLEYADSPRPEFAHAEVIARTYLGESA